MKNHRKGENAPITNARIKYCTGNLVSQTSIEMTPKTNMDRKMMMYHHWGTWGNV
jgi:hypothetical protein